MADIRRMQLGQVVDFCIAYNERQEAAEKRAGETVPDIKSKRSGQNPRQTGTREAPKRYRLASGKEAGDYFSR